MSVTNKQTWQCDFCDHSVLVDDRTWPKGWKRFSIGEESGLTRSTSVNDLDVCEACDLSCNGDRQGLLKRLISKCWWRR